MKLNGQEFVNADHVVGPFPIERTIVDKETGKPKQIVLAIFAEPVWGYQEFEKLYPLPEPPVGGWSPKNGGSKKKDYKDPQYLQDLETYSLAREGWTILKSIGKVSQLELDGVSLDDPTTWASILDKLRFNPETNEGLFSFFEYNEVIKLVDRACGIDQAKLDENRKSFLSQQQAKTTEPTKA